VTLGDADFRKSPMKMINRKLSKTTFYLSSITFVREDFLRMRVEANCKVSIKNWEQADSDICHQKVGIFPRGVYDVLSAASGDS
jgi:hypothetical protein